nr:MAG TPA: hypothetical protein [Caudoviricetes sp.]
MLFNVNNKLFVVFSFGSTMYNFYLCTCKQITNK